MSSQDKSTAVGAGVGAVAGSVLTGGSAVGTVGGAAVGGASTRINFAGPVTLLAGVEDALVLR